MKVGNFEFEFHDVHDPAPISKKVRDAWVRELVEELLENDKIQPIGPCPGVITYSISGDAAVIVQIYRCHDGKLMLTVQDCIRSRSCLAEREK